MKLYRCWSLPMAASYSNMLTALPQLQGPANLIWVHSCFWKVLARWHIPNPTKFNNPDSLTHKAVSSRLQWFKRDTMILLDTIMKGLLKSRQMTLVLFSPHPVLWSFHHRRPFAWQVSLVNPHLPIPVTTFVFLFWEMASKWSCSIIFPGTKV